MQSTVQYHRHVLSSQKTSSACRWGGGVASSMGMEVLLVDGVWNERNWSVVCGTARLED